MVNIRRNKCNFATKNQTLHLQEATISFFSMICDGNVEITPGDFEVETTVRTIRTDRMHYLLSVYFNN